MATKPKVNSHMMVTEVDTLPKGISIRIICDHGGYSLVINDGEPTWFKFDGSRSTGLGACYVEVKDKKLINQLYREFRTAKYWG